MANLLKQLKSLKNNPQAGAVSKIEHQAAKERLLSFIAADLASGAQGAEKVSFTTWFMGSFISKPVALTVAVLTLGVGSLSTVSAASSSLPGDTLYTVKRITEEAQLQLASLDRRAVLHTEFAERRLAEATALRRDMTGEGADEQHLTLAKSAMADYEAELTRASADLQELKKTGETSQTIAVVSSVQDKLGDMESAIDDSVAASSTETENTDALAAKQVASQTQQAATNVAVQVHEENETATSGRELEEMFRKQLGSIESRQTFDEHRVDTIATVLTSKDELFADVQVPSADDLKRMRFVIKQTTLQIPEAMSGFAAGGYKTAFSILQGIDTELLTLEAKIAQVEFTVTGVLEQASVSRDEQPVADTPSVPVESGS